MNMPWPSVSLYQVLTQSDEQIEIQPDWQYKQVTVRLWGQGVVLRDQVSGLEISAGKRSVVRAGQFILSRIDARNGAFGLVPEDLDGAVVSNDFPAFDINSKRLEPRFMEWMSKTQSFVALCQASSEGTTNRVRLKVERFLKTEIALPPLDEQRRIIARIEALAGKVEAARELRRQAMEEASTVLRSTLGIVFCEQLEGDQVSTIDQICEAIIDNLHSTPKYSDEGYPCIRSPDVGWGVLDLKRARRTPEHEYLRRIQRGAPTRGDIVFVREGGGTGKAALVDTDERLCLGQRVMMFRPDTTKVVPKFLLYQLLSPYIYDEQIESRIKGSASPHINISAIRDFRFRLPSVKEQHRIVTYLDDLYDKVSAVQEYQAATTVTLDVLLPSVLDRAFKGEL